MQDSVVDIETRTRAYERPTSSASRDLQTVSATVTVQYEVDPERVHVLYKTLGLDFTSRVIQPAVDETVKQVTADFTAEELITNRPLVKQSIEDALKGRLAQFDITQRGVSITEFQFSELFDAAIEQKVEAQQKALKANEDLERIKIEAQQTEASAIGEANANIAKAKGEAEAIAIINNALLKSPEYMEWLKTQRWNGELPKVTGGAIPFVEIPMEDTKIKSNGTKTP
jgi:regulator of protease activity HflC (stomatin/prohibitin superfamily)